jgi:hypothetical protein
VSKEGCTDALAGNCCASDQLRSLLAGTRHPEGGHYPRVLAGWEDLVRTPCHYGKRGTVGTMPWDERSRLGAVVVVGAAFSALALVLVPTPTAQIGLLLIAPLVAWVAAPGASRKSFCPNCGATRLQQRNVGSTQVNPATQAAAEQGKVAVQQGWEVRTDMSITCGACNAGRRYDDIRFVPRSLAPSAGEAVIHARRLQGE